jgi:hypothetical protein
MQPQALGPDPLSCREFLEGHSDFLDGFLPDTMTRRFEEHVVGCASCNRFDRVLRRGLLLAHNLPEIQPSANFQEKLQAQLMRLEDEPVQRPVMAGSGTAVVIAAVLGFIALTPFLIRTTPVQQPQPAPVAEPIPITPVQPLYGNPRAFPGPQITAAVFTTLPAETDFSPVIVQPPAMQGPFSAPRIIAYPMIQTADR